MSMWYARGNSSRVTFLPQIPGSRCPRWRKDTGVDQDRETDRDGRGASHVVRGFARRRALGLTSPQVCTCSLVEHWESAPGRTPGLGSQNGGRAQMVCLALVDKVLVRHFGVRLERPVAGPDRRAAARLRSALITSNSVEDHASRLQSSPRVQKDGARRWRSRSRPSQPCRRRPCPSQRGREV